ncbi:hypothetical protein [Niveispirillum sp. KHB5.9]|uniref:hypothetical protein n=1 Tax=Niveispirillum sp. KHB5.9 TaxID=3400269 RepID=UPI003A8938AA
MTPDPDEQRAASAWIGGMVAMLAGGVLGWYLEGRGLGFAFGMLGGMGLFWLGVGAAGVKAQDEFLLYEGWKVRVLGLGFTVLSGFLLFG